MHLKTNIRKFSVISTMTFLALSSIIGVGINNVRAATFTAQDVALHNTASDCWLIINNKVYNLTSYIPLHSGGSSVIIAQCGKDATATFNAGPHSSGDLSFLNPYLIGDLVETPVLTSVGISPTSASILIGANQQLTASPKDQNGAAIAAILSWSSNNPTVANVNATGLATGLAVGTTTIVVSATNGTTTVSQGSLVTVSEALVLTSIVVSPATASTTVGGTKQLSASPRDQNGAVFSGATVAWSSSNAGIASVNASGLVTGIATGTATITANATSGNASVSGAAIITISLAPVPPPVPPAPPPSQTDDDDDEDEDEIDDEDEDDEDEDKNERKNKSWKKDKDKEHDVKIRYKQKNRDLYAYFQLMMWKWKRNFNR